MGLMVIKKRPGRSSQKDIYEIDRKIFQYW